jgi:ketosteroid isomerase-like protein
MCKGNGGISMSVQENVQVAKDTFAALGRGDMQGLLALLAEGIEWIVRNGKVTNIREYIDTLALARGFEMATSTSA